MDHTQRYLVQVDRHIAEVRVHIAQQRAFIQRIVAAGVSTELAKSMLETLEGILLAFERHRKLILRHSGEPYKALALPIPATHTGENAEANAKPTLGRTP
jgi:hypothetical protein